MNWLITYAQVYSWLQVPDVAIDAGRALRRILIEVTFLVFSLVWIAFSPVLAFWGVCFPTKLFELMQRLRT